MEDLIKRYDELYEDMATSKDPKKMMAFGDAEKWVFHKIAEQHPEIAEKWLNKLEAEKWFNYLSRSDAEMIVMRLVNQDGTRGPHWNYDIFKSAVESIGGKMHSEPFYNNWALWAVANMEWSDHHKSTSEFVSKDQEPRFFYLMALEKLKDVDHPRFVREYFDL